MSKVESIFCGMYFFGLLAFAMSFGLTYASKNLSSIGMRTLARLCGFLAGAVLFVTIVSGLIITINIVAEVIN